MSWIAVGVAAVGVVGKVVTSAHQAKMAKKIHPEYTPYQESPYAKEQLGIAKNLFYSNMPGYGLEQQNIANSQANYNAQIGANATDSAQALALGGLSQGVTNNAYSDLEGQNLRYKSDMFGNLANAYQAMVSEGDKKYKSQMDKYYSDVNAKMALRNAAAQNWGSALNTAEGAAQYGNYMNWGKK